MSKRYNKKYLHPMGDANFVLLNSRKVFVFGIFFILTAKQRPVQF